ncbi:hypothetical protein KIV56_04305 [Cryobacterium breve]|uniref:Uncharacterized protein n=1 Tax=Cryobacterium breve TaxID=1259258 RepID=A0ABY7NJD7_9MICO|nr:MULTISPECIES: hypothetical protein [Cryobacterium]MDY7544321.1 hypothetical protein [Cryobacterium sp. 5B3]MEA9998722.1 hypothetical protein [Cryobacterium sp. RTS3]MEB0274097.1 hypothetical protein [Cryobacterium sp. 5B3]WBM80638.1 hypothetical protein KIV56_04305 [Cryobacterium breve]
MSERLVVFIDDAPGCRPDRPEFVVGKNKNLVLVQHLHKSIIRGGGRSGISGVVAERDARAPRASQVVTPRNWIMMRMRTVV